MYQETATRGFPKVKIRKLQAEQILGKPAPTLKYNHLFRVCGVSNDSYLCSYAVRSEKVYCLVKSGVNAPIKVPEASIEACEKALNYYYEQTVPIYHF